MTLLPWTVAVLAGQAAAAPAEAPLRGKYVTIASSPLRCELEITDAARYVLSCHGRRPVEGPVGQPGMAVVLMFARQSSRLEEQREYAAAADVHIQQQMAEYRFHPVVVPPPQDDGRSALPCVMATVSFADHLFLVDTFDRDEFCASVASGKRSRMEKGRHLSFRSRDRKDGGVPAQEFCREGWTLRFQD